MQIGDIIRRSGRRFGDAPAIIFGDRSMSFAEFDAATDRLGNALLGTGLVPGDRVAVLLPNSIEYLVVIHALAKSGLVFLSLNVRDSAEDNAFRVRDSGARASIAATSAMIAPEVEFHLDLDDVARMIADGPSGPCDLSLSLEATYRLAYTGGTTGPAKGVMHAMRTKLAETANYMIDFLPDIGPSDVMLHAAPVTHASGSFFLPHLARGARQVLLPSFDPQSYLAAVQREHATTTFLVPTMISMLLDEAERGTYDVSSLRRICYGASPIAPTVVRRAEATFGRVLAQTYGQAEAPMTLTTLAPEDHDREGCAGRPYTLTEVRVVDVQDRPLPPGELGEVVARGAIVMQGYWNRPEETAETLRNGWLHTGDIGLMDEEGFLYLRDRRHDVIISGGFNVYPREVEDVLMSHAAVRDAAVVSLPDETWGERVYAVVSTRSAVAPESVLEFARERLAGYKRPRGIEVWDSLPKSSAGKILRREIRDAVRAAHEQGR